jgi:hypothetical protein
MLRVKLESMYNVDLVDGSDTSIGNNAAVNHEYTHDYLLSNKMRTSV